MRTPGPPRRLAAAVATAAACMRGAGHLACEEAKQPAPQIDKNWRPRAGAMRPDFEGLPPGTVEHPLGNRVDARFRSNPYALSPNSRAIAVFGITGSGKSSTCNTLIGGRERPFAQADSLVSLTRSVAYRDYYFRGHCYRILDTPGIFDTHRSESEIREEIERLQAYAPNGLAAILIVVPHSRFTPEQEVALQRVLDFLGSRALRHTVVVVTHCLSRTNRQQLISRNELLEEISMLPSDSVLRQAVEGAGFRVVPVENVLEPAKSVARSNLHLRVEDTLASNEGETYDCADLDMRRGGSTAPSLQNEREHSTDRVKLPSSCKVDAYQELGGPQDRTIRVVFSCEIDGLRDDK